MAVDLPAPRSPTRTATRVLAWAGASLLLSACASTHHPGPALPQAAWQAPPTPPDWRAMAVRGPVDAPVMDRTMPQAQRDYDLPALIDLAQRNNPSTRLAWGQARQAASTVGLTEALFLPMISAHVIGVRGASRRDLPEILGQEVHLESRASGVVPLLTLQWLLFDFGERAAAQTAARNLSLGANFLFNAVHQKLIFDVTRSYYDYDAARQRSRVARESLSNSEAVQAAVRARREQGLATSIEEAQVFQAVAQRRLFVVQTEGQERMARQSLLAALGFEPDQPLRVAEREHALPLAHAVPEGQVLREALAARPDIMASIAAVKAAEAGVEVARRDFLPKIYMGGVLAGGRRHLDVGPLPALNTGVTTNAVLLGMSVPLYDGGLRRHRLHEAEQKVRNAEAALEKLRVDAMREIGAAATLLDTALAAYRAADALVEAADVTYDATLEAYQAGVGTVTAATEAATGLLTARSARADARAAAQVGAATLAFALGKLDSAPLSGTTSPTPISLSPLPNDRSPYDG